MPVFFSSLYQYFSRHKNWLYGILLFSFLVFVFFALKVKLVEDVYAIIPKDEKTEQFTNVFQNSKFADKLTIMVSLKDTALVEPDSLVMYADALADKLQKSASPYILSIKNQVNDEFTLQLFTTIQQNLPIFLDAADYKKIDTLIQPEYVKKTLANDIKLLNTPTAFALKNIIANDPSGISFLALKKLQSLQVDGNFDLYDGHIVTKDAKTLLVFITPASTAGNTGKSKLLFQKIDETISGLSKTYPSMEAVYFGGAVVSEGNAAQLRKDTMLTLTVTVVFIILFIGLYFRKKRAPVLILLPVLYGVAFSLACIYFVKGSISVIALGTGSIVLGIAVNYSLHVFNHYRHTGSVVATIKDLAFPLTVGSFTTVAGFLALQFAASDMLKDLGLFAAFSLVGAAICSLIFLPHFIGSSQYKAVKKESWIDRIASIRFETNKWVVLFIIVLTIAFFFFAKKVRFEPDMMKLNYMSAKVKAAEEKMNEVSGAALRFLYVVSEAPSLEEALQKNETLQTAFDTLQTAHLINNAVGVSSLYMSNALQQSRIAVWNTYWTTAKKQNLITVIENEALPLGFSETVINNFKQLLHKQYIPINKQQLQQLRANYLDDFITETANKSTIVTVLKVPEENKHRVIAALEKNTDATVLDRQYLTQRLTEIVSKDFNNIAWIISIIVAIVLFLTFGRIELMLMAFIPMLLSWVWILGIMAIMDIKFNIVNIIVSTLIFGLGDDYSLFVMDGLISEYKTGRKNLFSYKSSIIISAITTIAGLGVLTFAKHPALRSIAFISVTGILCVVLMAQVLIPFFFSIVIKNRINKKFHPWTLLKWVHSVISFLYFGFVSVLLTIIGFFIIKLNILGRKRGKAVYHYLLSKLCASVLFFMGRFKKRIINKRKELFKKPAVVIANHQSFLDILMMAMLNPRLILLTNKWVWNSPVFGWAIKMADFYPVANGIENSVELLKTQIDKGYSIVVFPEGTRSSLPPIKRFHKGAFYLAEKLHIDMVPVLLHGLGYTMTKGDYLLKQGDVTAKYLHRIKADDIQWGTNYQSRTKSISAFFKQEHQLLREELEQPAYFKEHLFFNYIYKGPILAWYLKIKTRLENYYQLFHEKLPGEGTILDLGCGYGFMVYMLYWASQNKRIITGVDYDEEKIATADHCFSKTDDVQFVYADVAGFEYKKYNGITIMDVLHYLQPQMQIVVIEKAINALLPGGVLIIRDGDADLAGKHKGTQLTELFSTKIFSFNKTVNQLSFLSGKTIETLAKKHGMLLERIDNTKYTSNVVWVLRKF
ncbi:MAG: 1-acyl-sn-glycerol-3-phosphate acyltransferase [Niabella sp.]